MSLKCNSDNEEPQHRRPSNPRKPPVRPPYRTDESRDPVLIDSFEVDKLRERYPICPTKYSHFYQDPQIKNHRNGNKQIFPVKPRPLPPDMNVRPRVSVYL